MEYGGTVLTQPMRHSMLCNVHNVNEQCEVHLYCTERLGHTEIYQPHFNYHCSACAIGLSALERWPIQVDASYYEYEVLSSALSRVDAQTIATFGTDWTACTAARKL